MDPQHTITREAVVEGIGLHTGNFCRAMFRPAAPNTGVRFVRTDLSGRPAVEASCQNVLGVIRGTTLGNAEVRVHTVEHLLSAVYALGIDNLLVELNANEPPVMDGSGRAFFDALWKAGLQKQEVSRTVFAPAERIVYESGQTRITLEPSPDLVLTCILLYSHPQIQRQEATLAITAETYLREIAPARTFCFDYEVEALKKQGLARGGSLDNAVVIGLDRIHNKEKRLRFPDEFVRHKILDFLGDLYLLGCPVRGHITATRPGHGHNINFVKLLYEKRLEATCLPN